MSHFLRWLVVLALVLPACSGEDANSSDWDVGTESDSSRSNETSDAGDVDDSRLVESLPEITGHFVCEPRLNDAYTLCDWMLNADAVVYGTLDEATLVEEWERGEVADRPLENCEDDFGLRLSLTDVESLHGEADEDVDVFVSDWVLRTWLPSPECDEGAPSRPEWRNRDFWGDGTGPLWEGQDVGMTVSKRDNGYLVHDYSHNPFFMERDDHLFLQNGTAFNCRPLEYAHDDFASRTFDDFRDDVNTCVNRDLDEHCKLEGDVPCLDGEDCCPSGCAHHTGTAFDLEEECRPSAGAAPRSDRFACVPRPAEEGDSTELLCTDDGDYAVRPTNAPTSEAQGELVKCDELDEFADGVPDVVEYPPCE